MPRRVVGLIQKRGVPAHRSEQRDDEHRRRDQRKREEVGPPATRTAGKHRCQRAARGDACQQADAEADEREHHALPQDHPQDIEPAGADRHTDPDFPSPPARRIRDQAVEAHDGEAQSIPPMAPTVATSTLKMLTARIR